MPGCGQRKLFPLITQILSMSLGLIAFILSAVAVSGCKFLALSGDDNFCYNQHGLFNINNVVQCMETGALYSGCTKYNSIELQSTDHSFKSAQAMGAIAAAFGGIQWAGCIFMLFFKFPAWLFKTIGGIFVFCFVAQMLTLLALNECTGEAADAFKIADPAYQCTLGTDGATSIAAAIFYLGIGILILVCPVPKTAVITCCGDCCENLCADDEEGGCGACCGEEAVKGAVIETNGSTSGGANNSVPGSIGVEQANTTNNSTVTETNNNDGTVTVKEERINPDGSSTVSVTTRPASNVHAATSSA